MKWPTELVIVRHGESEYNILRARKEADPLYQQFKREFEKDHQSAKCKKLAAQVRAKYSLPFGDAQTKLTPDGVAMAKDTGRNLKNMIQPPNVVFVSPYDRTIQTFDGMRSKWAQLDRAKVIYEDRIREQEHGLSLIYNDWRVFQVMHPEQRELRRAQNPYWYQYPQGESVSQVKERIRSFLTTLVREYSGQRVMLVTHHLTILSIRSIMERTTPEQFIHLDENDKPVNCGVTIYEGDPSLGKDGRLELKQYNVKLY